MSPEDADSRIILSRQTLSKYVAMNAAGDGPGPETLPLMTDEISILLEIAEGHTSKAMKIERLVEGWIALQEAVKAKLN